MVQLSGGVVGWFVDVGQSSVEREIFIYIYIKEGGLAWALELSAVHLISSCSSF
jgi:hypothetical protein